MCDFINSKLIHQNLKKLKDLISKNYKSFLPNFFEHFDKLITKPSSITLLLKKILEKYKNNYLPNKYIIIISDGNSVQNIDEVNEIINEARSNGITIVTYILSNNKSTNKKVIYNKFPEHLNQNAKNLSNLSSEVNYNNSFARYYTKNKDYNFSGNGKGKLMFESDINTFNSPNDNISNDLNGIKYEGINIRIGGLNFDNLNMY